jgi:hypothetical protein
MPKIPLEMTSNDTMKIAIKELRLRSNNRSAAMRHLGC